jgi:hypothetical protein
MLGVDRLDMIKGIPQKLLAFEKFLQEHPEWRDKVLLVQVTGGLTAALTGALTGALTAALTGALTRGLTGVLTGALTGRLRPCAPPPSLPASLGPPHPRLR